MSNSDLNIMLVGIGIFSVLVFLFFVAVGASIISINSYFKKFVSMYESNLKKEEDK